MQSSNLVPQLKKHTGTSKEVSLTGFIWTSTASSRGGKRKLLRQHVSRTLIPLSLSVWLRAKCRFLYVSPFEATGTQWLSLGQFGPSPFNGFVSRTNMDGVVSFKPQNRRSTRLNRHSKWEGGLSQIQRIIIILFFFI